MVISAKSTFYLLVALFVAFLLVLSIGSEKASAAPASNILPNDSSWMIVTRPGGNGMDARESRAQIYTPESAGRTQRLVIESACDQDINDSPRSGYVTEFRFLTSDFDSVTAVSSNVSIVTSGGRHRVSCTSGSNITIDLRYRASSLVSIGGVRLYRTNDVRTFVMGQDLYYANSYRFRANNSRVRIGISNISNPGGNPANYTGIAYENVLDEGRGWSWSTSIEFALPCNVKNAVTGQTINFYDTDHNEAASGNSVDPWWQNSSNRMSYVLEERYENSSTWDEVHSENLNGGDDTDEQGAAFEMYPNFRYRVTISGINYVNSIQVALPQPSVFSGINCPPPQHMQCSNFVFTNEAPGSYTNVQYTVRNVSGVDWPGGDFINSAGDFAGYRLNTAVVNISDHPTRSTYNGPDALFTDTPDRNSRNWVQSGSNATENRVYNDSANTRRYNSTGLNAGSSRTYSVRVQMPSSGQRQYGIRMFVRPGGTSSFGGVFPFNWMNWDSSCSFTVEPPVDVCDNIANVQTSPPDNHYTIGNNCYPDPTCSSVGNINVWVGQEFRTYVLIDNPASVNLNVTTFEYRIRPNNAATTGGRVVTGNAANVSADDERNYSYGSGEYETITSPGTYTVRWIINSEHAGRVYTTASGTTNCSTTITAVDLPDISCSGLTAFSTGVESRAIASASLTAPSTEPTGYTAEINGNGWSDNDSPQNSGDIHIRNPGPPVSYVPVRSSPVEIDSTRSVALYTEEVRYDDVGVRDVTWDIGATYSLSSNAINSSSGVAQARLRSATISDSVTCSSEAEVSRRPYVRFYGNDVIAGANFIDEGAQCTATGTPSVGIQSVSGRSSSGRYQGSSAELAAIATGDISNFLPGTGSYLNDSTVRPNTPLDSGTTLPANGYDFLAFAGRDNSINDIGGGFEEASLCNSLQPRGTTDWTTIPDPDVFPGAGNWRHTGDLTINGASIAEGEQVSIYVEGNVTISDNVTYSDISWSNREDIPLMRVYATGDISINGSVGTITGLYVAGGTISTCTEFEEADTQADVNRVIGACGNIGGSNRLTVYGALAANNIVFGRTSGDVSLSNDDDNDPELGFSGGNKAERIHFTPELYMALWALDPSGGGSPPSTLDKSFDYIASPPPVF